MAPRTLMCMLVISKIDYCSLRGAFLLKLAWRLQQGQKVSARLVSSVSKFDHISPVLVCLCCLSVVFQARFRILVLAYKALHSLASHYLSECLSPRRVSCTNRSSSTMLPGVTMSRKTKKMSTGNCAFSAQSGTSTLEQQASD